MNVLRRGVSDRRPSRWAALVGIAGSAAWPGGCAGPATTQSGNEPTREDRVVEVAKARRAEPTPSRLRLTSVMPREISGRLIAVINDADLPATAFHDKKLAPRPSDWTGRSGVPGSTEADGGGAGSGDQLTVVSLPIREPVTPIGQVAVSNSAFGPPQALALNPDGTRAYIAETRGPAGATAVTSDDLPRGRWLTAVDITVPESPKVVGTMDLGAEPSALDVSPDGSTLVVCTNDPARAVLLIPLTPGAAGGEFGEAVATPLAGVDEPKGGAGGAGVGDGRAARPSGVQWSPSGSHIGVTLPDRDEVVFYEVLGVGSELSGGGAGTEIAAGKGGAEGAKLGLRAWGEAVRVGRYPYSGRFTPDGKHFITTDLHWEPGMDGFLVEAPPGTLSVIELSKSRTENPDAAEYDGSRPVEHRLVDQAPVGVSPEGMAISPDGRHVVTANLQRSFLPAEDERLTPGGSLTLLSRDAATGVLTPVREFSMDAMPEGIGFDQRGKHVVVSQFRSFDPRSVTGEIAFWRLFDEEEGGGSPFLQQCNFVVGVGPGPHGVLVVR